MPGNRPFPGVRPAGPSAEPLALVAVVLGLVLFVLPLAIRFPLLDPDEGLHAEIAREMVESGDWLTPRFLGQPFWDKPILYCWAEAASLSIFGPNEAAVRLPGLMFGLLGALTTGLLAGRLFNRETGLIAGIFYATTILPTAMAQAASHDVAIVPWINLGVLLLWESSRTEGRKASLACTLGAGFFLGLSILTKGLEGVAVVGLAYGGGLLLTRRVRWPTLTQGAAVLVAAALVAAPWYLAAGRANPGYLRYYFVDRHFLGFATATQPHSGQPWWYYLPILLGGGLPWIGYLPVLVKEGRGERGEGRGRSPFPLLWCWLIGWPLMLTLARSKLATYVWPAFPPVAILAAVVWQRLIAGRLGDSARRAFARTFVSSSWSGPILLPATVWVVQRLFALPLGWHVWLAAGCAAALAPLPLLAWRAGRVRAALAIGALSMAVQFVVVMTLVVPPVTECFSARELAEHFNRDGQLPPRLWLVEQRLGSLIFYLDSPLRTQPLRDRIMTLSSARAAHLAAGDVVAVPETDRYHVPPQIDLGNSPYQRVGRYKLYTLKSPLDYRAAATDADE
ncbi:MAG: glycosyltransferase family 39 protein [Thermoguttaceae bacterium]